jgi:hypothetical protein
MIQGLCMLAEVETTSAESPIDQIRRTAHARIMLAIDRDISQRDSGPDFDLLGFIQQIVMLFSFILAPIGLYFLVRNCRRWFKRVGLQELKDIREILLRCLPVNAYPLKLNAGPDRSTGIALICFDEAGNDVEFMRGLAERLSNPGHPHWRAEERHFAMELLADTRYERFRRRRVPASIVGDATVYVCDVSIHPLLLTEATIGNFSREIPVLAQPGDTGWIVQAPYWVFEGAPAPSPEHREALIKVLLDANA